MNSRIYKEEDFENQVDKLLVTEKPKRTRKKSVKAEKKSDEVVLTNQLKDIDSENLLKESINKKIEDKIKHSKKKVMPTGDSHRDRRMYLKYATDYFKMKKKLNIYQWADLIKENIKRGKEKHQMFIEANNKAQIEYLIDKEMKQRDTLKLLKTPENEIEDAIEKWYSVVIKEGSQLMEK